MNHKIKSLAVDAGIHFESNKMIRIHSVSTTTLEKFAELVIQECINVVKSNGVESVEEHFEIKETI